MRGLLLDKKNLLTLLFLLILTVTLNSLIFSNQLNYGFRDVDWQVLYYFKLFGNLSLDHLLENIKVLGVYISESYYVGLLEKLFGLNFIKLHQVSHFFKVAAAISVYILILIVFKKRLLAFITSLIYTISYTHAGVLFQLASGVIFLTTILMNSFLITYYYSLLGKDIIKHSIIAGVLLISALILKPERMYPLIALILLVEIFLVVRGNFLKSLQISCLKRTVTIFLPLIFLVVFYIFLLKDIAPSGFTPNQFFESTSIRIDSVTGGNWQLLIYPFASFGSIFLYEDYWKLLGMLNFQNFTAYLSSLIFGPVFRLGVVAFILISVIFRKSFKLTLITMVSVFIFGLIIFWLNTNWQHINMSVRIHFDPNLMAQPAIFGFYIFILNLIFFIKWIRSNDPMLLPLIVGFSFAILFTLLSWIPSDIQLIFMGPQRYLSIPSIGTSLFISGLLVIVFNRLQEVKFTKQFAWIIFLILAPLIFVNFQVANKFFDYELTFAGLIGSDQIRMKNKFRYLAKDLSQEDKSLFYFDETADKDNGYFDEGTTMAGFEFWTRINSDGTLNTFPEPGMLRTNVQCIEHTHQSCLKMLHKGLAEENGEKGIWYKDVIRAKQGLRFYKLTNFYAFRFINKDIVDIRKEVLEELTATNH